MREIKFRGKRLDNGEWEIGDLLENQGRNFIYHATSETTIEDNDDGRIVVVAVEVDPATIGQYTGLKDKKGAMILRGIYCCCQMGNPIVRMWSLSMVCTAGHSTILKPRLSTPTAHIPTSPSKTVVLCSEPELSLVTSMTTPIC